MKSLFKYLCVVAAGVFGVVGSALADPCGGAGLPACLPEPGSLPLVILAVAGAAAAAKYFKK